MPANPVFDAVQAGAATLELSIESQDDEKIVFDGPFGHATVWSDGRVESKTPPYQAGLEALIAGQEPPVKAKNGKSKAIVPTEGRKANGGQMAGLVRDVQVSDLTLQDIKDYICPSATDQEAFMFLKLCQARNLNPFVKECYLIKYASGGPATMVVGKDAFCRRAEEHPQFDGFKAGIIVQVGDKIDYREGTFMLKGETLVGAWSEVFRRDRKQPFKNTVSRCEYDTGKSNWQKMPATMLRKVSLVQALREAFASEFSGMYDSAEMGLDPEREVAA